MPNRAARVGTMPPISTYAFMARLNPGETAEIPMDEGEPNMPVMFDELRGLAPFEIGGERFGLLLCVPLRREELVSARRAGTGKLRERLEGAGFGRMWIWGGGAVA